MALKKAQHSGPGLPVWSFLIQIPEIWSFRKWFGFQKTVWLWSKIWLYFGVIRKSYFFIETTWKLFCLTDILYFFSKHDTQQNCGKQCSLAFILIFSIVLWPRFQIWINLDFCCAWFGFDRFFDLATLVLTGVWGNGKGYVLDRIQKGAKEEGNN